MFNVTNQAELEAFCAYAMPVFLERLKAQATKVGDIELATTLEGITSLPARQLLGGVEKTVLAPLYLLTKDVDSYIASCVAATAAANTAASDANAAAKRVTDAIVDISTQKQAALNAAASANAAATAASQAKALCDSATAECERVTALCNQSKGLCDTATAECKVATQKCIEATSNANSAANNANIAATAANQSATNLNAIKSECQDATSRCNSTNATAEEKIVAMDAVLKSISAESNAAPVRLEVSVPESISTKNKVVQRIGIQLYPTYVMQNVLFQRVSGESVTANPSGILSVLGTGTTKFYLIPPQNTEVWKEVDVTVRQPLIRLTSSGVMRLSNKVRIV